MAVSVSNYETFHARWSLKKNAARLVFILKDGLMNALYNVKSSFIECEYQLTKFGAMIT